MRPRPTWTPDKKHPGLSITGESRASYEQRVAAWEAAQVRDVEQELAEKEVKREV